MRPRKVKIKNKVGREIIEAKKEMERDKEAGKWMLIDSGKSQYGRKLSSTKYEFKEDFPIDDNLTETKQMVIDLEDYDAKEVEDNISAYGYSLLPWRKGYEVLRDYGSDINWIIAECIFEVETGYY